MKCIFIIAIILIFSSVLFSQSSTLNDVSVLIPEWKKAGYIDSSTGEKATIPTIPTDHIINITNHTFGEFEETYPNDSQDDYDAITDAINHIQHPSMVGLWAIYLPEGEYNFSNTIEMKSDVILMGDGSDLTLLNFDMTDQTISDPYKQNLISFNNASESGIEDLKLIRSDSFPISSNDISRAESDIQAGPATDWRMTVIEYLTSIGLYYGIEDIDNPEGNNIFFNNSNNCWIIGVESYKSFKHHVTVRQSNHIEIIGSYFHKAKLYGNGGYGYGVFFEHGSEYNLAENNIFRHLRHSMIAYGDGPKYNVFGYNYSREVHKTNFPIINSNFIGDMVCHGTESSPPGPEMNLFEGNIGRWIWVDGWHDENGLHNTFLRNRASRYGIWIAKEYLGNINLMTPWTMGFGGILGDQPEQIIINNYFKCSRWFASQMGYGRKISTPYKPIEKNSIVKKRNFWTQYYTRWWSNDNKYDNCHNPDLLISEESYYMESRPTYLPDVVCSWPFRPKHDDKNGAKWRWYYANSKTLSKDAGSNGYLQVTEWSVNMDIESDVTIQKGECLTIESGVTITFDDDAKLIIKGSLFANGTETNQITFTNREEHDDWDGIEFGGDGEYNNNSLLKYCIIENGKKDYGGGIKARHYDNLQIENCIIRGNEATENGGGLHFKYCSPSVIDCEIIDNYADDWGGGIYLSGNNESEIYSCQIKDNIAENKGGGLYINEESNPRIENCNISFNHAGNQNSENIDEYGGGLCIYGSYPVIVNSYICNNMAEDYGGGLYLASGGYTFLEGCIISNNEAIDRGSAILCISDLLLSNSTISNNLDHEPGEAAVFISVNHEVIFQNSIIWGNLPFNLFVWAGADFTQSYSCVQNGISGSNGNINNNPNFVTPTNGVGVGIEHEFDATGDDIDWSLNTNSPCTNTGDTPIYGPYVDLDIYGTPRIMNEVIDMGACETFSSGIYVESLDIPFGSVAMGTTLKEIIRIHNQRLSPISIFDVSIYEDGSASFDCSNLPESIAGGEFADLSVYFTAGPLNRVCNAQIKIQTNDPYFPYLNLNATGQSKLAEGYNWISFPKLEVDLLGEQLVDDALEQLIPHANYIYFASNSNATFDNEGQIWLPENYYINRKKGYKLKMSDYKPVYSFVENGELISSQTIIDLDTDEDGNFIGYWLFESQNMDVAFGEHWDKVESIMSEYWYYSKNTIPERGAEPVPSSKIRPLHYGHSYIVKVSEYIPGFQWHDPQEQPDSEKNIKSDDFVFEQTADYEVIDILNIDESIEEIGVLEDGSCIGAIVVDEPSEQILIYPDGSSTRGNGEITFEIIYSGRSLPVQQSEYLVYEASRDDYVNKKLHSNDQFYSKVLLSADENQLIPNTHTLQQNYPNPFNPITNIAYSIPETEKVNLSIYNIKGQVVKTLVDETKQAGNYSIRWNGTNESGKKAASGLYFYKLSAGKTELNKKMMLLK